MYKIEKTIEIDRLRNFTVIMLDFPEILIIGGVTVFGVYNAIRKWNILSGEVVPLPHIENANLLKRIEHTSILIDNIVYIIGGVEQYENSLVTLNLNTWTVEERQIELSCKSTCINYCYERKHFYIFSGKFFYVTDSNFQVKTTTPILLEHHFNQNRFRSLLHKEWMYVFGGYNGVSYSKRFFRFNIDKKIVQYLPSLPNAYNIRITGSEMLFYQNKIFFVLNMFSLSRHNFLYIYNLEYERWENNYLINMGDKVQMINVYSDERMCLGLKTGMKSFGSFVRDNNIYVFASDAMFFDYPNVVYKIEIPLIESPYPCLKANRHEKIFDFSFQLNGHVFDCHRFILSKFSMYFHYLFESKFPEHEMIQVEIENIKDEKNFEFILDYMYNYPFVTLPILEIQSFYEILEISNYFQIPTILFDLETMLMTYLEKYKVYDNIEMLNSMTLPRLHCFLSKKKLTKSEKVKTL